MKPWILLEREASAKVEVYRTEAEVRRRLEPKSFRQRIAETLLWLACRMDPMIQGRTWPGLPT